MVGKVSEKVGDVVDVGMIDSSGVSDIVTVKFEVCECSIAVC